ncbi:MAG: CsgG/HfaB family protein [Candidatus Acidiferrales bacterium]
MAKTKKDLHRMRWITVSLCALVFVALVATTHARTQQNSSQPLSNFKYQFKIGVLPFVDNTGSGGDDMGAALSRAVQAEFTHSTDLEGRVVPLDQGMAASDVDDAKAVELGRAHRVDVVLVGTVLEASSEQTSKSGNGPSFGGITLGGSANSMKATVTLQGDIYNTTTGKKIDSIRVTGNDSETKVGTDVSTDLGGLSSGGASFDNAPIGKALHKAVADLTKKIAAEESQMIRYQPDASGGSAAPQN